MPLALGFVFDLGLPHQLSLLHDSECVRGC